MENLVLPKSARKFNKETLSIMKKLVFGVIATVMFSVSAFAENKIETKNAEPNKVYKSSEVSITKAPNCKDRGGTCTITGPDGQGGMISIRVCCDQIVINP